MLLAPCLPASLPRSLSPPPPASPVSCAQPQIFMLTEIEAQGVLWEGGAAARTLASGAGLRSRAPCALACAHGGACEDASAAQCTCVSAWAWRGAQCTVDCSGRDAAFCAGRHRGACFKDAGRCGACVAGRALPHGRSAASDEKCVPAKAGCTESAATNFDAAATERALRQDGKTTCVFPVAAWGSSKRMH